MQLNYFIITLNLIFSLSFLSAKDSDQESVNIANLEGIPSAIVGNTVNAITGAYCDFQTDLQINGPHPFSIQRFYSSITLPGLFNSFTGPLTRSQVWEWNHGGLVYISNHRASRLNAHVYKGSSLNGLTYRSVSHKDEKQLKIRHACLMQGITNYHTDEISGRTNHKNTRIFYRKNKDCLIRTGSGVETTATLLFPHDSTKYRIESEKNPNGNALRYSYQSHDNLALATITAHNKNAETLNFVNFLYPSDKKWKKEPIVITAQDGRQVFYYFDEGKHINRRLRRVVRTDGAEEKYHYDHSSRYLERIVRKEMPDQRYVDIKYSKDKESHKNGRVTKIKGPIGHDLTPRTLFTFNYHRISSREGCGRTEVLDAHKNKKEYQHDWDKRLYAIYTYKGSHVYRNEQFHWGGEYFPDDGKQLTNLLTRFIQKEKEGEIVSSRSFEYDDYGNVTTERLYGNLTGYNKTPIELKYLETINGKYSPGDTAVVKKNGCERLKKTFTYTGTPYNLLSSEKKERSIIRYSYLPNSNCLSAKFICDLSGQIKERYFYFYDKNAALAKEIIDDGCSEDSENLSSVTERKLVCYTNRTAMPIGLPEVIQETYYDFANGQERLEKKKINDYSPEGYLIRQDHYDSNHVHQYSLYWKYDRMGNVIEETDALGHITTREYDSNGNKTLERKPGVDYFERYAYDYSNRLVTIHEVRQDSVILKTAHAYNLLSQCISTTDRFGNTTKFVYDELGRCIQTEYPSIRTIDNQTQIPVTKTSYNRLDQPTHQIDFNGNDTCTKFTIQGKPYRISYPDGSVESSEYTLDGLLYKHRNIDGTLTIYEYDYKDRPTKITYYSAAGEHLYNITAQYSAFHKIAETDAAGHITTYQYDPSGHLSEMRKGNQKTAYFYDGLGRVEKTIEYVCENDFIVKKQSYDHLDRIIEEKTENANGELQSKIEYAYDVAGNRTHVYKYTEIGVSVDQMVYDSYQRPIKAIDAIGNQVHIAYNEYFQNALGQRVLCKETTDPLGNKTYEVFNALGYLEEVISKNKFDEIIQKRFFIEMQMDCW